MKHSDFEHYEKKVENSIKKMLDIRLGMFGGLIACYGVKNQDVTYIGFGFLIATPMIQRMLNYSLKQNTIKYYNGLAQVHNNCSFLENLQDPSRQEELEKLANEGNFWKEV